MAMSFWQAAPFGSEGTLPNIESSTGSKTVLTWTALQCSLQKLSELQLKVLSTGMLSWH